MSVNQFPAKSRAIVDEEQSIFDAPPKRRWNTYFGNVKLSVDASGSRLSNFLSQTVVGLRKHYFPEKYPIPTPVCPTLFGAKTSLISGGT